jgi:hypothetical protein
VSEWLDDDVDPGHCRYCKARLQRDNQRFQRGFVWAYCPGCGASGPVGKLERDS